MTFAILEPDDTMIWDTYSIKLKHLETFLPSEVTAQYRRDILDWAESACPGDIYLLEYIVDRVPHNLAIVAEQEYRE